MSMISQVFKGLTPFTFRSVEVKPLGLSLSHPALDERSLRHREKCEETMRVLTSWCERVEAGVKIQLPVPLVNYGIPALANAILSNDPNLVEEFDRLMDRCHAANAAYFKL